MVHTDSVSRPAMRVELLSHGFKVTGFDDRGKVALLDFARSMAQYGLVKVGRNQFERKMLRVFAAATQSRSEFRFHRNQFDDFLRHLASYGISRKDLDITVRPQFEPEKVEHPLKDTREPRPEQVMLIDYLSAPCDPNFAPSKVLTLQPGKGKTFTDLMAIHKANQRVVLVIKGMYVDKWIFDVAGDGKGNGGAFHYEKGDLMVVRGSKDMVALQHLALAGELKAKFIIITSKTWYSYMKTYEAFDGDIASIYPIPPDRFYEVLKAGQRHIDEVHQDFHCNFRQDLYTHVGQTNSLSGTLDSDDPVTNRFYEICWPMPVRPPDVEYHRYIDMVALWYSVNEPRRIRTVGGTGQYSHVAFEQSIMRNKTMLKNYFDMLTAVVRKEFVDVFEKGQSMLVYFAMKEMCTLFRAHLKQVFPQLEVNRYVDEDDYEECFMKGDVVCTTYQSAGTAVDRPNLRNTFMTIALSTKQGNEQLLSRARPLKDWPDVTPKFIFLAAREIPKHVDYTHAKFEKLKGKVLHQREYQTSFRI